MKHVFLLLLLLALPDQPDAGTTLGYYRYPAIHGDTVVFTSEGDLWTVGIDGGLARRLTSHQGMESHAAISADGGEVAFSAQYEGPTEVYTMPLKGGKPTRRSFWGETSYVVGWTPDGRIIYRTGHFSTLPNSQLATIDPETHEHELIPLGQASEGDYDPTGSTLFFTRLAFQGSHTKRYRGGTAQNLWRFREGDAEATPLTDGYLGTSKSPMWWQSRVYFASDRDGTMNIWSMDEQGEDLRQHTFHTDWDVKSPSLGGGRIVYQLGADLHVYDIAADEGRRIPITLTSDFDQTRDRWVKQPADYLTSAHISPDGSRVVLTARGRVFVAPSKQGRLVAVTQDEDARYRYAAFMPDGESILVLSDKTGETEFWKLPADGVGEAEALTADAEVTRREGIPSPDGKWIAYTDVDQKLWLLDMRTGRSRLIAFSEYEDLTDLIWSPDSRWLAFVEEADNYYPRIMFHDLSKKSTTAVTSDRVDSYSPAWSPDGQWLYFLSDRYFVSLQRSPWGPRQPEPFFDKTTKIYHVPLVKDLRSPFAPDDELHAEDAEDNEDTDGGPKNTQEDSPPRITIDFDRIEERAVEVPIPAGNHRNLTITEDHLFWRETLTAEEVSHKLVSLEIKNHDIEAKTIVEAITGYELSADRKHLLVRKADKVYVLDASGSEPDDLGKAEVDLSAWTFSVDPRQEWRQMLREAWRLQRDYFYDSGLHGVDWPAQLAKHLPLAERVADRDELTDVISQMVGELSALHIYVWGGDRRQGPDDIIPASLGAVLTRDEEAGGYRIDHIFRSEPDYPDELGPLARPGAALAEGDIIESVNGVPTLSVADPSILLKNQAGRQVLLGVRAMPSGKRSEVIVEPITPRQSRDLRYDEWEYSRRQLVEILSEGRIGYVHLRSMGGTSYSEWARNFYPVFNRKGLIIDVRHNTGGNIDSWILERLMRRAWFYWKPRVGEPYWNMHYAFRGHMVVLCDEWTMSDGEAFTEGFRRLGLGKIIGTRTWGGEIWLSFSNFRLVDKGVATSAQSGVYGPEGEWLIEGHGVEPDILIDNLPHATYLGKDAQVEAAIAHLMELIGLDPVDVPPAPAYPDKSVGTE